MPYMKVMEHDVEINPLNVNKLCIGLCCMSTYCRAADVMAVMLGSSLRRKSYCAVICAA